VLSRPLQADRVRRLFSVSSTQHGFARVYADTPVRVTDFLSMASGKDFECEQSYTMMATLLYIEERAGGRLAHKIEQIRSVEQAYKLDEFIRAARE
jgi:hypothetical protein